MGPAAARQGAAAHVDPNPDRQGLEPDELARVVHQSVAEVRRRNALVVAGVRLAFAIVGAALHAIGVLPSHGSRVAVPTHVGYLGVAILAAWLLHRRWRVTAVAFSAAVIDVALVAVASLATVWSAAPATSPLGYMVGILLALVLCAAVALPPALVAPLVAAVIGIQVALGIRAGLALPFQVVGVVTACTFVAVVLWASMRMVKLAAGLSVTEAAASLAERHARELEEAHAEMAAQRDRLIAAQNEAEALAQVIVHDLKNPLATLLQYVSRAGAELKAAAGAGGVVDLLDRASEEGRRLSNLIGDLLLVYRLERGVMAPEREQVPVGVLLHSIVRRFAVRAAERGAAVEIEAAEDLVVAADLDLAQRMLENLVSNALRHVSRGDRVRLEARSADGEVWIAVRNSGPPVSPELRGRLFDRFVTGGHRDWQNAGLGLYLCRLVAEAHAGSIALVDAPGWNVSFEVRLPLAAPEVRPAAASLSAAP